MTQDEVFLKQVESLCGLSWRSREEAEAYAADIQDPELKQKAERLLEES